MNAPFTPTAAVVAKARAAATALLEYAALLEKRGRFTVTVAQAEVDAMRAVDKVWPDWLEEQIAERVSEFDLEPRDSSGFPLDMDTARCIVMPDGSREWTGDRL